MLCWLESLKNTCNLPHMVASQNKMYKFMETRIIFLFMEMNKKVSLCCIFYETGTYFGMTAWCRGGTNIGMTLEVENWGGGTQRFYHF